MIGRKTRRINYNFNVIDSVNLALKERVHIYPYKYISKRN